MRNASYSKLHIVFYNGLLYAFALVLLLASLFTVSAIIFYDPRDPSFNSITSSSEILNFTGVYGAYASDFMLQTFGYAAFIPIIIFTIVGVKIFMRRPVQHFFSRTILTLLLLPLVCTGFSMLDSSGGFLGYYIVKELSMAITIEPYFVVVIFAVSIVLLLYVITLTYREWCSILKFSYRNTTLCFYTMLLFMKWVHLKLLDLVQRFKGDEFDDTTVRSTNSIIEIARKIDNVKSDAPIQSKLQFEGDEGAISLPSIELLFKPLNAHTISKASDVALSKNAELLQNVLMDFGISCRIVKVHPGPVVTLYELEPAPGIKASKIIGLSDDIARSMSSISARIAVIPARNVLGVELPNVQREVIYFRNLVESAAYQNTQMRLPLILGHNIAGANVLADLSKMPHLLIAGTTGSGKSVAINTMILSLLYKHSPKVCKFIMIDPKMLELSVYDGIPHLLSPVVTNPKKAVYALKWVVQEMERRYKLMSLLGVRNLNGYNELLLDCAKKGKKLERRVQTGFDNDTGDPVFEDMDFSDSPMPYIVVVVDEMADLMLVAGKEIEAYVQRLAQMARAAGIHVIIATQRPSVDVITGVIKANFPTRVSFQVTSKIDSRTILGEQGAEQLLGMGDMLYMSGAGRIERVHGPFISDAEVESVVNFLKNEGAPKYQQDLIDSQESESSDSESGGMGDISLGLEDSEEDLYKRAVKIVISDRKASTSYIQRSLRIGYNRAANLMDRMESEGIVSEPNHTGKREILSDE